MDQHCLTFGPFQLNSASGILLRDGEPLPVGQRGVRLLQALLERRGEVLTKDELLDTAWPDVTVEEANLSVQIALLRKALGPAPDGGEWIVTIPRVGYRLLPAADAAGERAASPDAGDGRLLPAGDVSRSSFGAGTFRLRWAAALAAIVLVAVIVGFMSLRPAEVAAPATSANSSIAVLPFDDMTGNAELAYFGAGVAGDIIAMLARVPELTVAARNSSFRFRGSAVDVRRIGEELGVAYVLEGSVRKDIERVRIVAQLIDARTGKHVWAESFDRTGIDPLVLQDEVTAKIVATLAGYTGALRRAAYRDAWGKDSARLQEYDYYLRATDVRIRFTPDNHERAFAIWREGTGRFPYSSLLQTQGALLHMDRYLIGWSHDHDGDIQQAGRLAREALAQPNPPPLARKGAHYVLAFVNLVERNSDQALVEAEAAIALASHDGPFITGLAEVPIAIGQTSRALEWIELGARGFAEDDPWQVLATAYRAWALVAGGQSEVALGTLTDPRLVALGQVGGWKWGIPVLRAMALSETGRLEEARAEIGKLLEIDPTYSLTRFRNRSIHFDPALLERGMSALAAAGLPEN